MPCLRCLGFGFDIVKDYVPYGHTWVKEPCPDCVEKNVCPRCGAQLRTAETQVFGRFIVDAWWCSKCSWRHDAR